MGLCTSFANVLQWNGLSKKVRAVQDALQQVHGWSGLGLLDRVSSVRRSVRGQCSISDFELDREISLEGRQEALREGPGRTLHVRELSSLDVSTRLSEEG